MTDAEFAKMQNGDFEAWAIVQAAPAPPTPPTPTPTPKPTPDAHGLAKLAQELLEVAQDLTEWIKANL